MATQVSKTGSGLLPYRLTVRQFLKMIEANIFPEDDRVELLGGILSTMTTNNPHGFVVTRLASRLRPLIPADWTLREEKAVQLGRRWRPYPDISVLNVADDTFEARAPEPRDIALLVEVSDTTYAKDSGIKLRRYAHLRIPHYGIVHLDLRRVEVYSDPQGRHRKAFYRTIALHSEADDIPVAIEGQDLGRIAVKEILPR